MSLERYNIRVYGLCFNHAGAVLLTDERIGNYLMTKFPGGGLELGEGLEDCLRREWREELSLEVSIAELFYINEFLQVSAFNPKDQILSIYYIVRPESGLDFPVASSKYSFPDTGQNAQVFRWAPLATLQEEDVTFPIDKAVVRLLRARLEREGENFWKKAIGSPRD